MTLEILTYQEAQGQATAIWDTLRDPNVIAALSALAAIASAAFALFALWPTWKQWRVNRILSRDFGSDFYSPEVLERSTRYYVPPNCTSIDPSIESEMRNLVVTEEKLFDVLDRFLSKNSSHRHLLLLADSGMGKSSCLLNYYVRNQNLPHRRRRRIAMVPLGIPEADQHIQSLENRGETILFLDAFDEDTKAIQDHKGRLQHIMAMGGHFGRVAITCRTQFFLQEEEIPRETGVVRVEPRRAGEKGVYEFQKLYLSPLNDRQVKEFLRKRYPLWRLPERRKARELVQSVPFLSVRPMLLAYIPDLLESNTPIRYAFELYEALIDSWLDRESRWVNKDSLQKFSEQLAVDLYCNREQRGAERIGVEEMASLAKEWGISLSGWQLTGRSLLNRDAAGNYKFAHRSILEYLFVRRFLQRDSLMELTELTDQMTAFLREIIFTGSLRRFGKVVTLKDAFLKVDGQPELAIRLVITEGKLVLELRGVNPGKVALAIDVKAEVIISGEQSLSVKIDKKQAHFLPPGKETLFHVVFADPARLKTNVSYGNELSGELRLRCPGILIRVPFVHDVLFYDEEWRVLDSEGWEWTELH